MLEAFSTTKWILVRQPDALFVAIGPASPYMRRARAVFGVSIVVVKKMTTFAVGESFSSYEELQQKLTNYQKEKYVQLTHRDSRTLEAARKRVPKRVEFANPTLRYYTVHFACIFGGKKYMNRGLRPNQRFVYKSVIFVSFVAVLEAPVTLHVYLCISKAPERLCLGVSSKVNWYIELIQHSA